MMTPRLWRTFYDSLPRHPLFWQTLHFTPKDPITGTGWTWRLKQVASALLGLLMFIGILALGVPLLFFSYLIVFMGGVIAGGNAAAGISSEIAREQEKGRYDLIALSPPGMFGAGWALATRFLRTNRNTLRLAKLIRAFHLICFLGVILIVVMNLVIAGGTGMIESIMDTGFIEMAAVLMLIAALHLDFIQAVLLGALIGILAPSYTSRRIDSSIAAVGGFLGIQFTIYLVIYASLNLMTLLLLALGIDSTFLIALLTLILVYVTHEIALYSIWRMVQQRLNLESRMLQTLKRFGA